MDRLAKMFGAVETGTFLGLPAAPVDAVGAGCAIIGADRATPYETAGAYCAGGPAAIRRGSLASSGIAGHMNFDLGRAALPDAVDCGDVATVGDPVADRGAIRGAVRAIRAQGASVVLLGGDDSVQIPMIEALEGPLHIVQIDAHIDWRDEVSGERLGLSSTQRRASEMEQVTGITLVGQRGIGSARASDVRDAQEWGATLVSAREVARDGVARAVASVPGDMPVAVCLDLDGLDPAVVPSVIAPTPGGLSYWDVVELIEGIAGRAEIVALGMVEFMPDADVGGVGAVNAAHLLTTLLGVMAPGKG